LKEVVFTAPSRVKPWYTLYSVTVVLSEAAFQLRVRLLEVRLDTLKQKLLYGGQVGAFVSDDVPVSARVVTVLLGPLVLQLPAASPASTLNVYWVAALRPVTL